jgi:2-polyprenyl-3-methyl-5-hydroxy-6-metoxy-1,4-benzoquinol methylase
LGLDDVKTQQFWEETAQGIGTRYDELGAVMVTGDTVWANYRHKMEKEHLFRLVKVDRSMSVLDLGCGVGRYSIEFAKRCNSVLAVDYAPTFIEYANKVAEERGIKNITFLCQSITEYSYLKDLRFDIIHLGGVLMYMNDESIEDLIHQLKQYLNRGGLLIARNTVALKQRLTGPTGNPYIGRTPGEYQEIFQNNGFTLMYRNYIMFPPLPCHLYNKLPVSLQKARLLKNLLALSLSILAKLNFMLLKRKWVVRRLIDPWRKITNVFCIYSQMR